MSQDGSYHHPQDFQTSPFDQNQGLYHTDMQMQFASSVPHRQPQPQPQPQQHLPMNFQHGSFQNQEVIMPPQFSINYPGSPYERSDSLNSCTTNTGKQVQSKAERRAEHNAIERARRESLNVKFQQLAFTLPNLQNDSRPSKSTIIDRTLDFVKGAILKEERMNYRIKELEKFSRYLLSELDKKSVMMDVPASSPPPGLVKDVIMPEEKSPSLKDTNGIINRRPVSRSSVAVIPKLESTNWPNQQQLLDQPSMFKDNFQQQNQAIMFQKFQDHSITKQEHFIMNEQQQHYDQNYMINNNTFNMMESNHLMHKR